MRLVKRAGRGGWAIAAVCLLSKSHANRCGCVGFRGSAAARAAAAASRPTCPPSGAPARPLMLLMMPATKPSRGHRLVVLQPRRAAARGPWHPLPCLHCAARQWGRVDRAARQPGSVEHTP